MTTNHRGHRTGAHRRKKCATIGSGEGSTQPSKDLEAVDSRTDTRVIEGMGDVLALGG